MDDALLAIVRAARLPAPVCTAATQTLGEFRNTHEPSEPRPLRERLTAEVWDGIMDAATSSSYYA